MKGKSAVQKTLQGRSLFTGDLSDKDALALKVKRSVICRGKIRNILFPPLPEGVSVIQAKDIPGKNGITVFDTEVPVLSSGEVRYKGEPILLLTGPDERILEELEDRIEIDYEEHEPYLAFEFPKEDRIRYRREFERGSPETAFSESFQVIEEVFSTGLQEHYYCEPHGVYVRWENDVSTLSVSSSTRWPFHVHKSLCEVLAVPYELISVSVPSDPDRSLDGKLWYPSLTAAHTALAAWITKKNIKSLYSREEDFLFTPKRAPAQISYKVGLDRDGNLHAADIRILLNVGAYPVFSAEVTDRAAFASLGGYSCPHLRVKAWAVETDLPPLGPFSGMGGSMSLFAMEVLTDRIRDIAQTDPIAWEKNNLMSQIRHPITGPVSRQSMPDSGILDLADQISDFKRKHAAYELARKRRSDRIRNTESRKGIGIALGCQGSGFMGNGEDQIGTNVELHINTEGKVSVLQSAIPGSQALHEIWKKIITGSLGIAGEDIDFPVNTGNILDSGPSTLSRSIVIITKLVESCCDLIKKKRFRSPLPLSAAKSFRLSRTNPWNDETFTGEPFLALSWAVAIVELRIDPLTFSPEIDAIWLVVDGGQILDEAEARKTLEIEIGQALGWTILEKINFVNGAVPLNLFADYRIPSTADSPSPKIVFFDSGGKRQAKGIGELALSCFPAAYVKALSQAAGVPITEIPVSLETLSRFGEARS